MADMGSCQRKVSIAGNGAQTHLTSIDIENGRCDIVWFVEWSHPRAGEECLWLAVNAARLTDPAVD